MMNRRKGKYKWLLGGCMLLAVMASGCSAVEKAEDLFSSAGFFFEGAGGGGTRSTQTKKSRESEERLIGHISVEQCDVREDAYGIQKLTAQVTLPDFSAYFADNLDAVDAADAKEFEELLFALAEEELDEAGKSGIPTAAREVTVDLTAEGGEKAADEWTKEELEALARQAAFEAELEEFALDIMGNYLSQDTDWDDEIEDAYEDGGRRVTAGSDEEGAPE